MIAMAVLDRGANRFRERNGRIQMETVDRRAATGALFALDRRAVPGYYFSLLPPAAEDTPAVVLTLAA